MPRKISVHINFRENQRMKKRSRSNSSSSEDEECMQALREAADENFLKDSLFNKEINKEKEINPSSKVEKIQDFDEQDELKEQYLHHGLSQSCRDFISKKLNERLDVDIALEENIAQKRQDNNNLELVGIRLFNSSNTVLTSVSLVESENVQVDETTKKQKLAVKKYNEKTVLAKCKKVSIDPEVILAKTETKYWTDRKPGKLFRYKKLNNGTLVEIKGETT